MGKSIIFMNYMLLFYVDYVEYLYILFSISLNNIPLCLERSELDWELAVDPRGELFYIESNPLEKPEHGSAEQTDKADTAKYLTSLHQNRRTARGLSCEVDSKLTVVIIRNVMILDYV
jgi:hypothetical protein